MDCFQDDTEKAKMLASDDYGAFRVVCSDIRLDIAKWLIEVSPDSIRPKLLEIFKEFEQKTALLLHVHMEVRNSIDQLHVINCDE